MGFSGFWVGRSTLTHGKKKRKEMVWLLLVTVSCSYSFPSESLGEARDHCDI